MNRTKIEWTQFTWNPISGCTRNCKDTNGRPYCYANRMAYRLRGRAGYPQDYPFAPTLHMDRLTEPQQVKRPSLIFTCSMGELFDPTIIDGHPDWYRAVWDAMAAAPQHTYQILTKQPGIAHSFFLETIPVWLGTSIDGTRDVHRALAYTAAFSARLRFLSFEPLLAPIAERIPKKIGWVIIGAQTGPGATPPKAEWVQDLIDKARRIDAAVFLKDNLHWPETVKEFPETRESRHPAPLRRQAAFRAVRALGV